MTVKTITLKGNDLVIRKEGIASVAITPGYLLERITTTIRPHTTAGADAAPLFAVENDIVGDGIDVDYEVNDTTLFGVMPAGAEVFALLPASAAAIVVGDLLESNGDGTLRIVAAIADLGGTLTGTIDDTLGDVTFDSTWSNAQSDEIDKNIKELQAKINALLPAANPRPLAVALEAVDNSGGGTEVRIKVEVL